MTTYTFTDTLTDPTTGLTGSGSGTFTVNSSTPVPQFGCNYDIDTGMPAVESTMGINPILLCKTFNTNVPTTWPGHTVDSHVTKQLVCLMGQSTLTTTAPYISAADQTSLANLFKLIPSTGTWHVTIKQEGEGAAHGYTIAQLLGAHQTAYNLFQANKPANANAVWTQNLMTYSASSGGRGSAFPQWIFCAANGFVDLPIYYLDWYPTSNTTNPSNSITAAFNGIRSVVPGVPIGIGESNYATSSGILYTGTRASWFTDCWTWAKANGLTNYMMWFKGSVDAANTWPPDQASINALSAIAHESGL